MDEERFAASRARLQRARAFIRELEYEHGQYVRSGPLEAKPISADGINETKAELHFKPTGLIPGLIIGDAIHSMRTALDLMASELARINFEDDKNVYFPFAASADDLPKQIKKRNFQKTGDDSVKLLLTFRPYKGGNKALRAIHDLDIEDKHTALIPSNSQFDVEMSGIPGQSLAFAIKDLRWLFPVGKTFGGEPVVATLEKLVELVDGIIEAFDRMVALRGIK